MVQVQERQQAAAHEHLGWPNEPLQSAFDPSGGGSKPDVVVGEEHVNGLDDGFGELGRRFLPEGRKEMGKEMFLTPT